MGVRRQGPRPTVPHPRAKAGIRGLALLALLLPGPAAAEAPGGTFVAHAACEAFQSKNRRTNPGGVTTEPGRAYRLAAGNVAEGDYVRIVVPGAPVTADRWVAAACGTREAAAGTESTDNLLAMSWLPAFCETQPRARECRRQAPGLSAHGLWPQPSGRSYCGVPADLVELDTSGRWRDLPAVELDPKTRARLQAAMPGTASFLDRHEWLKHGTCHGGGQQAYFEDLLTLSDAVAAAGIGDWLAERQGEEVEASEIRAAFDAAFGKGTGARVEVRCVEDGGRTLIAELTVALTGEVTPDAAPGALMRAADRARPGCPAGEVDPPGLQ